MIKNFANHTPDISEMAKVSETSDIIGDVIIKEGANIWYGAVLRGDVNQIYIGKNTNVQDNAVIHVSSKFKAKIGDDVTIGHSAIVHACTISNNVLVGMGSIVLDGALIEENVIIGAGSLIPPNKVIPSGVLVIGSPAKIVRELTDEEIISIKKSADNYVELAEKSF